METERQWQCHAMHDQRTFLNNYIQKNNYIYYINIKLSANTADKIYLFKFCFNCLFKLKFINYLNWQH